MNGDSDNTKEFDGPLSGRVLDWILLPAFSFFSSLLVSAILVSLYQAMRIASSTSTDAAWQLLNNSGGFWNGHFGAISLIFLAWGLYLQARAIRKEAQAEFEKVASSKAEVRRWMLQTLQIRRSEVIDRMQAIIAWQDTAWQAVSYSGHSVATRLADDYRHITQGLDIEPLINIREREVESYLDLIRSADSIIEKAPAQEKGPLASSFGLKAEQRCLESLLTVIRRERQDQETVWETLAPGNENKSLKARAGILFDEGWRFELRAFRVLTARRLTLAGEVCDAEELCAEAEPLVKPFDRLLQSIAGNSNVRRTSIKNKQDELL